MRAVAIKIHVSRCVTSHTYGMNIKITMERKDWKVDSRDQNPVKMPNERYGALIEFQGIGHLYKRASARIVPVENNRKRRNAVESDKRRVTYIYVWCLYPIIGICSHVRRLALRHFLAAAFTHTHTHSLTVGVDPVVLAIPAISECFLISLA